MSTQRIYNASDRVTVSKPGYDAVSPPAVDYKYLALDSRLNQGRPLEVGLVPNNAFGTSGKVFYSTTYPSPPAVDIFAYKLLGGGSGVVINRSSVLRDDDGSTAYQRSSWVIAHYTDGFIITDNFVHRHSKFWGSTLQLYYIAWRVK